MYRICIYIYIHTLNLNFRSNLNTTNKNEKWNKIDGMTFRAGAHTKQDIRT